MPALPVETKSLVGRECEDAGVGAIEGFGDGEGDGEGETLGDADGSVVSTGSGAATGATVVGFCVTADVVLLWLTP